MPTIPKTSGHPRTAAGQCVLIAGEAVDVSCPGATANTFVDVSLRVANTILATVDYKCVPGANKFTVTALTTASAKDGNNISTLNWEATLDPTQA